MTTLQALPLSAETMQAEDTTASLSDPSVSPEPWVHLGELLDKIDTLEEARRKRQRENALKKQESFERVYRFD